MKGVEISSDQPFIFLKLYWLFSFRITFFNGPVAAIHSVIGYIEQIIFDSSYLLKTATYLEEHLRHSIFLRTVYLFHDSKCNHPSLEVVDLFLSQEEWQSSIFWRALYLFWLENLQLMFISKKCWFQLCDLSKVLQLFTQNILGTIHCFNGIVHCIYRR